MFDRSTNILYSIYSLILFVIDLCFIGIKQTWLINATGILFLVLLINLIYGEIRIKKKETNLKIFLLENGYDKEVTLLSDSQTPNFKNNEDINDKYFTFVYSEGNEMKVISLPQSWAKVVKTIGRCSIYAMEQFCIVKDNDTDSYSLYKKF